MSQAGLKKILVIDHSGLNRLQLKLPLERNGFTVLELDNAEDYFYSLWNYTDIGLILMDIHLQGMSGIDFLARMREYSNNPWPPVVMVSANHDAETIANTMQLGAKDYLGKPFHDEDLLRRVEKQFGSVKEICAGRQLWSIDITANDHKLGTGVL